MTLWVFSNHGYGYGEEVRDAAAAWARARGLACRVVISGRVQYGRPTVDVPVLGSLHALWRRAKLAARLRRVRVATGVDVEFVEDVNAPAFVQRIAPGDFGVVAGFNQIFEAATIARFTALLNAHPSLLPLYRGPAPSRACLANGESHSGYSWHRVSERIDAGEVLHQGSVAIAPGLDAAALDRLISAAAAAEVPALLDRLLLGKGGFTPALLDARRLYRVHVDYARA